MTGLSIQDRVIGILAKQLDCRPAEQIGGRAIKPTIYTELIVRETRLVEDLGQDSLDVTDFVMSLQEEFIIEISDDDAEKFCTVGDVIDYVTALVVNPDFLEACTRHSFKTHLIDKIDFS